MYTVNNPESWTPTVSVKTVLEYSVFAGETCTKTGGFKSIALSGNTYSISVTAAYATETYTNPGASSGWPANLTYGAAQSVTGAYTNSQNGCLRVVPGSHLKRHRLHDEISPRHTDELRAYANPDDPGFSQVADEIDVPVRAGDLVIGYGSLLHASHANQSDERRTVLTMWYYPDFTNLPERTRATIVAAEGHNSHFTAAAPQTRAMLAPLQIEYDGDAEPIEIEWVPGPAFK